MSPHSLCSAAKPSVNIYVLLSLYGLHVSLVPQIPHTTGKRKTGPVRSNVTHDWLISKKLCEIVLYFTSSSSSPRSANVQSA